MGRRPIQGDPQRCPMCRFCRNACRPRRSWAAVKMFRRFGRFGKFKGGLGKVKMEWRPIQGDPQRSPMCPFCRNACRSRVAWPAGKVWRRVGKFKGGLGKVKMDWRRVGG